MSTVVMELYTALRSAGVSEEQSSAAAAAVVDGRNLATKADLAELKVDISELESRLIKWNVGAIIAMAAVVAAIVKL